MKRLAIIALNATCIFSTIHAFTPFEFLQHLQQQQAQQAKQIQQQAQTQTQQQAIVQAPQILPTTEQPAPTVPKEIFKPFNGKSPLMLKGCFKCDNEVGDKKIPSFRVYFKGKETISDDEGFFSIPIDEESLDQYTLVLTKLPFGKTNFDKNNTIKGLIRLPERSCKCYTCQRHGNQWIQRETNSSKDDCMLPDNAVIISIDPKYIDHLEPWNLNLHNNFIQIPKIVLNTEVKNKPIDRASAKSLLCSLDATVFHEEVYQEVKQTSEKVKIALAQ